MRSLAPVFIALVLLGGPAAAEEVEFRRAQHRTMLNEPLPTDAGKAAIQFDDFLNTDWERLARNHFTAYPLTDLSSAQIAELAAQSAFDDIPVLYSAPATEDYRAAKLVFLSAGGMRRFQVTGLMGIVLYGLGNDRKTVERVTHSGRLLGKPDPDNAPGGGFVAMLAEGQTLASERIVSPDNPAPAVAEAMPDLAVTRQIEYRFSGDDSSYLFVQYEADTQCEHGCCQYIYILFREDPGTGQLTQLKSSMYACDV